MLKKVLLLVGLLNIVNADAVINSSETVEVGAISIKEEEILNSFSEHRELAKKVRELAKKFNEKRNQFNALVKKESKKLKSMQEKISSQNKTDLAGSAMSMKNFEKAKAEAQTKITNSEKELHKLEQEGAELDNKMFKLVHSLRPKIEKALSAIIEESKGKIKVVYGDTTGRLLYMDPKLDRTSLVLERLSKENL